MEGRKRRNEGERGRKEKRRERFAMEEQLVGWFFGGGKFRDLFRWKVGWWTVGVVCVVAVTWPATLKAFPASYFSSFREFLSRMFTFPGSPFEDKRVCEREREREIGFSPFHLSSGQFQIALSRLVQTLVKIRLESRKERENVIFIFSPFPLEKYNSIECRDCRSLRVVSRPREIENFCIVI